MVRDLSNKAADYHKLQSQQRRQQSATPLRNATVSGGSTRWIGLESLIVEGSAVVRGVLIIEGPGGEIVLEGTMNADGDINLTGNLNVAGAGKISAGSLTIDDAGGGRIAHPTVLVLAAPIVGVNSLEALGDVSIQTGSDFIPHLPYQAGTPNVKQDSSGKLWRTTP